MHARFPVEVASPEPTPTVSPTGSASPTPGPLSEIDALPLSAVTPIVLLLIGAVVVTGALLIAYSRIVPKARPSVVRSWIAVSLVVGLLMFTALAFTLRDVSLRSAILGAFTTSVGSVIAFFFSSRANEKANKDRNSEVDKLVSLLANQNPVVRDGSLTDSAQKSRATEVPKVPPTTPLA